MSHLWWEKIHRYEFYASLSLAKWHRTSLRKWYTDTIFIINDNHKGVSETKIHKVMDFHQFSSVELLLCMVLRGIFHFAIISRHHAILGSRTLTNPRQCRWTSQACPHFKGGFEYGKQWPHHNLNVDIRTILQIEWFGKWNRFYLDII